MRFNQLINNVFFVFLFFFSLTALATAESQEFNDAQMAYIKNNYAKALPIFRSLAKEGNAHAQLNLGIMYYFGQGVPKNYEQSVRWLRLASEQDIDYAQVNLGAAYENGEGVPQNYILAHMWYNLAAAQANENQTPAAIARDSLAKKMTPVQISEAQELARKCTANKFKGC
jgi:TPR repeat protein